MRVIIIYPDYVAPNNIAKNISYFSKWWGVTFLSFVDIAADGYIYRMILIICPRNFDPNNVCCIPKDWVNVIRTVEGSQKEWTSSWYKVIWSRLTSVSWGDCSSLGVMFSELSSNGLYTYSILTFLQTFGTYFKWFSRNKRNNILL